MVALFLIQFLFSSRVFAANVSLDIQTELSPEPLTTEQVWEIDPAERNPHRARWALDRQVQLLGVTGVAKQGRFVVQTGPIVARTQIRLRAEGPGFLPYANFSCSPRPDDWFSTRAGAQLAAQTAADLWQKQLSERRARLAVLLSKVRETSPEGAVARAYQHFQDWRREAETDWRARAFAAGRTAEWRSYLLAAKNTPNCKKKNGALVARPKWEDLMEEPAALPIDPEQRVKVLARAPARRWNGLFSVRVMIDVGSKTLSGQFLIDSGAAQSVMSPLWLEKQGVVPELIELPRAGLKKINWAGGTGFARVGQVAEARLSGFRLPMKEFLLLDTELFTQPESIGACCDGVLGADFLRNFAVEFVTDEPSAIRLWPKESFNWGKDQAWLEVSTLPSGELVSEDCQLEGPGKTLLQGGRWDTGSDSAVEVHAPYAAAVRSKRGAWHVNCHPGEIFRLVKELDVTQPLRGEKAMSGPFVSRFPAFNIGMEVLGRGRFVLDLSHGRIWFQPQGLERSIPANRTGLRLAYRIDRGGERELYVVGVRPGSSAAQLAKEGLRAGLVISEVDSEPAADLDLWKIEQRLAGVHGEQVVLQWETDQGRKLVPLSVRVKSERLLKE